MEFDQSLYDLGPGKLVADRFEIVAANRHGELVTAFEVEDRAAESPEVARCEMHVFPSGLFENEEQAREFSASWKPWMRIESPHVQRVREVANLGSSNFLVIADLPRGVTLRQALEEHGRFSVDDVLAIGKQLLGGLVEIHTHGLVHGDVKPSTVFVEGEPGAWRATLVDGGITPGLWSAKDLGEKTALIGTPFYAPIEQFGGDSPDVQSDVYNVATVLFELVTGVLPWPGRSFVEVFQAKLVKSPPSMAARAPKVDIDPNVERAIVTGMLAVKSERYASALEFLERLTRVGAA